jgi:hypothetical protein
MEKITTKSEFLERLKDIRIVEVIARQSYEEDAVTFKNFEIVNTIHKIKLDEDKHIALLDDLINMLSHT